MKNLIALVSLFIASIASASVVKTEVYRVVSVSADSASGWTELKTMMGSTVNVNCSKRLFDDTRRDRVASFDTTAECVSFISDLRRSATAENPAEVNISSGSVIELKISL